MSAINIHRVGLVDIFSGPIPSNKIKIWSLLHSICIINRYTGNTIRPYSVGEHTLHLHNSREVQEAGLQRAALLHDLCEPFTSDLPSPFKKMFPLFVEVEDRVQRQIFEYYNEPWENMLKLDVFDKKLCKNEMPVLIPSHKTNEIGLLGVNISHNDQNWRNIRSDLYTIARQLGFDE